MVCNRCGLYHDYKVCPRCGTVVPGAVAAGNKKHQIQKKVWILIAIMLAVGAGILLITLVKPERPGELLEVEPGTSIVLEECEITFTEIRETGGSKSDIPMAEYMYADLFLRVVNHSDEPFNIKRTKIVVRADGKKLTNRGKYKKLKIDDENEDENTVEIPGHLIDVQQEAVFERRYELPMNYQSLDVSFIENGREYRYSLQAEPDREFSWVHLEQDAVIGLYESVDAECFTITFDGVVVSGGGRYIQPDEGNVFVYPEFTLVNNTFVDQPIGRLQYEAYINGKKVPYSAGASMATHKKPTIWSGIREIDPYKSSKASSYFEVPADYHEIEFHLSFKNGYGKKVICNYTRE